MTRLVVSQYCHGIKMILLFSFFLASISVTGKIYIYSKYLFGFL